MKFFFIALVAVTLLSGCSTKTKNLLDNLPQIEAESIKYIRAGGGVSTALITVKNMTVSDGYVNIGHLEIYESMGPFFNVNLIVDGYKRKLKEFKDGE